MRKKQAILAGLFVLALPSVARANGGTPLMWANFLHLVVGNALIGLLEGVLLAKVFGLPKKRCVALMIVANYLSAWLGTFLIPPASATLPWTLHSVGTLLGVMVIVTYVLTIILEYPFVAIAFRGHRWWLRKAILGSLLVQTVSYGLLVGWYWMASGTSLYTGLQVVEPSRMSLPQEVVVYFISAEDGDVYSGTLADREWTHVAELGSTHRNDRLLVWPSDGDTDSWDLMACVVTTEGLAPRVVPIREGCPWLAAPSEGDMYAYQHRDELYWSRYGPVPKLGQAQSSSWDFRASLFAGLVGMEEASGKRVRFSLETPFIAWIIHNATHLPGDKVLLQLGDDQVCVLDPEDSRITLIARGRGPIAVIARDESKRTADGDLP